MNKDNPKILLVGAGAVGTYFCGRLAQAGAKVSAVSRSDYDVAKDAGYDIKSIDGDFIFKPENVLRSSDEYADKPDYLVVAMKSLPELNIPEIIKGAVSPETSIVLIQNGIYIEKDIASAFPDNELISAVAFIGVTRIRPGFVEHKGAGRLEMGIYPKGKSDKLRALNELFEKAKVNCEIVDDIEEIRWRKEVWNVPFNSISVLGRADTKMIVSNPVTLELARNMMTEVCAVAEANGHKLSDSIIDDNINYTIEYPAYKTSMLVDFENGRPIEKESILGHVIKAAEDKNISVPHLESVYALLNLLDNKIVRP